jgi:hypothetical protein
LVVRRARSSGGRPGIVVINRGPFTNGVDGCALFDAALPV